MRTAAIIPFLAVAVFGSSLWATPPADLVKGKPLANVSAVKAGKPFLVGVLLEIKPGWHVYWKNPGDAGLPTRVQWTLPSGFNVGELRFPVPEVINEPGGIVIYGYTDQVLLTAVVTPPATLPAGAAIHLAAEVKWLCCNEVCLPGQTNVDLQLTAADEVAAANAELFDSWEKRLPKPASKTDGGIWVEHPLILSDSAPQAEILSILGAGDVQSVIPGAVDGLILTIGKPEPRPLGGIRIAITAKVLAGQTVTATSVPVLIAKADPAGRGSLGYEVTVPIVPASPSSAGH